MAVMGHKGQPQGTGWIMYACTMPMLEGTPALCTRLPLVRARGWIMIQALWLISHRALPHRNPAANVPVHHAMLSTHLVWPQVALATACINTHTAVSLVLLQDQACNQLQVGLAKHC